MRPVISAAIRLSELLGCPISRPLAACCVCLELRPLPSPGITRLQWYCEPLRHPSAPGLSLTGVRLIIPDHAMGFPVLRALSLCTCCRHYPGAADGRTRRSKSPTRVSLPRFHVRVGLHIVLFEVCSAFTRVAACTLARSPYVVTAIRRLQTLRLLHACSGRFRRERSPGGACTHRKSAALSRRTWKSTFAFGPKSAPLRRFQTSRPPSLSFDPFRIRLRVICGSERRTRQSSTS